MAGSIAVDREESKVPVAGSIEVGREESKVPVFMVGFYIFQRGSGRKDTS